MTTMNTDKGADYSSTVFLPKTSFSMRGDLPKKEPGILDFWNRIDLYGKMLELRKDAKPYILHDGPPYANGHIHLGHALNKILKDILIKSQSLMGRYAPYIPGWDCHGLPIEQALLKEMKIGKRHIEDVAGFRARAREFARRFIDIQRAEFRQLGVLGDWDNPYVTMSNLYEGTVIRAFRELLEKGYIRRDKKAIYWCVSCETALADAEVEYKDKTSPSVYVKFTLLAPPPAMKAGGRPVSLVAWTTTPWTLPSNMAAAVAQDEPYSVMESAGEYLVVASKLAESFAQESGLKLSRHAELPGKDLLGLEYAHCLAPHLPERRRFGRPVVAADFVEMGTGTGIVHIAPGHGEDDFHLGKKLGLDIFCPVKEDGTFNAEAGAFEGKKVFESNKLIVETMKDDGTLLAHKDISHSYPHCWRCKQPVIFRATEQWFLHVDEQGLRNRLVEAADRVAWYPAASKTRMVSMLRQRPDWCLSRQRYWGTPILALYCKSCGKPQTDGAMLKAWEERVFKEGSDFWFTEPVEKLLPAGYKCSCGGSEFRKEKDILDVWLDSGVSWYAVARSGHIPGGDHYPVDMYLEGSDQHRGWFQTSLVPSVALNGKPPYRAVITHGMTLDEKGYAMHKSAGNAIAPQDIMKKYGAEVLRLWTALCDFYDDVSMGEKVLAGPIDTYRKIRNTLRYLMGNLSDFRPAEHRVADADMQELDRYFRHRLALMLERTRKAYNEYELRHAIRSIADFCILDLSSFYLDALKDRLYTLASDDPARRSAQTALYDALVTILPLTAPVLSFTAEEAWGVARAEIDPGLPESVFLYDIPEVPAAWKDEALAAKWDKLMELREPALKAIEELRRKGEVGSSLEARLVFRTSDPALADLIASALPLLPQFLIVSGCALDRGGPAELSVEALKAEGAKCPRCWQWRKDIGADAAHAAVCARCAEVLGKAEA
ncbi:MAG TPA: isoleucine--tRNA ligase [Elusimicrobiales bacterium]|nr:isoleucine--tRNA ligase [Elusimicrobiales bacterium]